MSTITSATSPPRHSAMVIAMFQQLALRAACRRKASNREVKERSFRYALWLPCSPVHNLLRQRKIDIQVIFIDFDIQVAIILNHETQCIMNHTNL